MQRYTVYLYLETALHVSGDTSTHHQERKLIRKILIFWFIYEIIFQYIPNKMQRYTVYLYLETVLHVSGGTSTHYQERKQLKKILIFWFIYEIIFQYISTRCNFTQFIYIWKLLYMFRVVPPPIIRSANN